MIFARHISLLIALLFSCVVFSQGYKQSYTDPCTGIVKSISVPADGIMVTYYGQMKTFYTNDFSNGSFESWAKNIYSSYGGMNPCGSALSVFTAMNMAQGNVLNVISIMNALSMAGELQLEAAERAAEEAEWANDPYGVRDMTPLMLFTLIYQNDVNAVEPYGSAEVAAIMESAYPTTSSSSSVASGGSTGGSKDGEKSGGSKSSNKEAEVEAGGKGAGKNDGSKGDDKGDKKGDGDIAGDKGTGDKGSGSKDANKSKSKDAKKSGNNRVYSDFMKFDEPKSSPGKGVDIIAGQVVGKDGSVVTDPKVESGANGVDNGSSKSNSDKSEVVGGSTGTSANDKSVASGVDKSGGSTGTNDNKGGSVSGKSDSDKSNVSTTNGGKDVNVSDKSVSGGNQNSKSSSVTGSDTQVGSVKTDGSSSTNTSKDGSTGGKTDGTSSTENKSVSGTNTSKDGSTNDKTNGTSSTENKSVTGTTTSKDGSTGGKDGSSTGSVTGDKNVDGAGDGSSNSGGSGGGSVGANGGSGSKDVPGSGADADKIADQEKKTNLVGGAINSIQKSTEAQKPQIILSSDFAGFNFKSGEVEFGGKGTAGYTNVKWDGTKSHGLLLDYTSQINGPNLTAFRANLTKRRVDLYSLTGTVGFYGKGSAYASVAVGQLWSFPKVKGLKVIYMAAASVGQVYRQKFAGTAVIAGGMYDWRISKRFDVKLVNLFIYAPYISYHDDLILKSPYVIVPIVGTNIAITKKFKFNVNFGGAYSIGQNVMNFTLMFGTRFAL